MPQYFQLISKQNGEPESFQHVDDQMREHFGAPPDPKEWYEYWYPVLMEWGVAFGKSFAQLRELHGQPAENEQPWQNEGRQRLLKIIDYLDERYTPNAWAMIGKG